MKKRAAGILTALMLMALNVGLLFPVSVSANEAKGASVYPELYMVRSGDNLSSIAEALCDDKGEWKNIYDANSAQIADSNLIYSGQLLAVPVSAENSFSNNNLAISSKWSGEDWLNLGMMTLRERKIYLAYLRKEPEISSLVKKVVEGNGGKLDGFESRCKTPSSLYNKLYLRPEKDSIDNVSDIVRYTEILPEAKYTSGTKATLDAFIQSGWSVYKLKNYWLNTENPYQGINVQMINADGLKLEIQFHTQKSFDVKNSEAGHGMYEEQRLLSPDNPRYAELTELKKALYKDVTVPEGVETILEEEYKKLAIAG